MAKTALIVVDMLNHYEHEDADKLVRSVEAVVEPLKALIDRVVLGGQVTEQCILYSALDAHIRHLDVSVPRDAVAHIFEDLADASLRMMERNMHADVCAAGECRLGERH